MTKWELARYIIDAKKSIDTILFISEHGNKIIGINLREKITSAKTKFYVCACVVLDKCFPKSKKEICKDSMINAVYYERDKNFAHKDDNYQQREYSSLSELADEMKSQLEKVAEICEPHLPQGLTLDYLSFDSELFRIIHGVTKEKEEAILNIKHPNRNKHCDNGDPGKIYSVFSDTEDIKKIDDADRSQYATILSVGLCMEETLQHLQDGCIRTNVLYNTDIWLSVKSERLSQIFKMRELKLLDVFDIPYEPKTKKGQKAVIELMRKEGLLDDET